MRSWKIGELDALAKTIGDTVTEILIVRKRIELHEAAAAAHRTAARASNREHAGNTELPETIRYGRDIAERAAIAARAELAILEKRLEEQRQSWRREAPTLHAALLLDRLIADAMSRKPTL